MLGALTWLTIVLDDYSRVIAAYTDSSATTVLAVLSVDRWPRLLGRSRC